MKPKDKSNLSNRNTQPRPRRLIKGKTWIISYNGQNIVKGYAKHFRVDLLCAIKELRLLGLTVSDQYEQAVKQTLENQVKHKKLKQEKESDDIIGYSDDNFAFIVGYTTGGAPYGIRWEDMPTDEGSLD